MHEKLAHSETLNKSAGPSDASEFASAAIERPVPGEESNVRFGSDLVAEALRDIDIPYIALNPGASFRGLHDSLVNHLGNKSPQMLVCLHEEHAVAIAHGYAKVTGRAMAAAVHSNVGLFHATMAIFNAWCDRMPVMVIGATGPVDASARRPWIEWIHTARDQGAIVRDYTKWDDQPGSPAAARESILRANWLANTSPKAPVYVNLDVGLQEMTIEGETGAVVPARRYMPEVSAGVSKDQIEAVKEEFLKAKKPLILAGRVSRDSKAWEKRVKLAELLGARVLTDLKVGAAFPTDHPLHLAAPGIFATPEARAAVREADLILSLDWVDMAGLFKATFEGAPVEAKIIQVSQDHTLHNGWSMDYQGLPLVDIMIGVGSDEATSAILDSLEDEAAANAAYAVRRAEPADAEIKAGPVTMAQIATVLRRVTSGRDVSLTHLPLGWDGAFWHFRRPLDFLGSDGGGGIGGGPGISVGAALALRGTSNLPLCIAGDGDFLMGAHSIWTAAHYRIPLIIVVANNQSFYNDEVHQERVARLRGRPAENKWIGQRMTDPEIDIAGLARAQGAVGIGPVKSADELEAAFRQAIEVYENGGVAVVDVRTEPGYTPAMASALTKSE